MGGDTNSINDGSINEKHNNPLSRKINKILETRLESDKDTLDALKELSTFFPENTLRSRRNLRGKIERRSVGINEEFVCALKEVKEAVDHIYSEVSSMNDVCNDMRKRLLITKSETHHLIHQTNSLQTQSQKLKMQEEVAEAFVSTFQLTSAEAIALTGATRDSTVTPEFFEALEKTQTIRNNTKYLLQTGHQKTALDIMEQMNVVREAALERLYRWFQIQSRSSEPSPLLPQALAVLEEREVLFNLVIEEWIVMRRGWLNRGFLDALTLGGPGGSPRPIELQAHDPLRYVGDMLAWIHQALPSERESCQNLFSKCYNIDSIEKTKETMAGISESVCRPLKARIEQMIISGQSRDTSVQKPVQLYKISSLLQFYCTTIEQVTGKGVLVSTLEELQQLSYKMFISALQSQVTQACERIEPPGDTFTPTTGVARTLNLLTEIVTAATVSDDSKQDFKQIISCVVDPLVNALLESASALGPVESSIYLLNCLHQLHMTLSLLHTTDDKLEMIQNQIDNQMKTLAQQQINAVFLSLGLAGMFSVIQDQHSTPLSQHPACQALAIQSFVAKLDSFLSAPDHLMLPHTRLLLSSSLRKELHHLTCQAVLSVFTKLYNVVHAPENLYPDPHILMPKHPDTIKALLV